MASDSTAGNQDDLYVRLTRALAPAYEMEAEIGRGGMAIVYRARDTRLKRGVAVKLLPPELAFRSDIRVRFLREAETAARLSHPNIVPIYTVDERDGLVYFVMALIQGGSVGDRLRQTGAMPVDECRRILREVASALGYAHRNGVVHRDIKPDNILLDSDSGRAMVTDFGIARAASEEGDGSRLTATGAAIGTPAYMSPEQCAGDRDLDGRSDLYSLGTVAYHMLAGEPPFIGTNTPSVMMKQVTEMPRPLRERRGDVPDDLERITMRLLEKDPANRFPDGDAVVAALEGAPFTWVGGSPPATARRGPNSVVAPRPTFEQMLIRSKLGVHLDRMSERLSGPISDRINDRIATQAMSRDARRAARDAVRDTVRDAVRVGRKDERDDPAQPPETRIRGFRRQFASWLGMSTFLVGVNYVTMGNGHHFWWAFFPVLGIGIGVLARGGSLWADGVRLDDLFSNRPPDAFPRPPKAALTAAAPAALDPGAVPPELLQGSRRDILRQAVSDRRTALDLIGRLTDAERKVLPDVKHTAQALFDRIVALASALKRLDDQSVDERLPALDARIAAIEGEPGDARDRERRLSLLKRQRDMLADLAASRAGLLEQYESAGILLQNLTLDLLKIRSSGLDAAMSGITSATQEARALSREIGYVLDAAKDLEKL